MAAYVHVGGLACAFCHRLAKGLAEAMPPQADTSRASSAGRMHVLAVLALYRILCPSALQVRGSRKWSKHGTTKRRSNM